MLKQIKKLHPVANFRFLYVLMSNKNMDKFNIKLSRLFTEELKNENG